LQTCTCQIANQEVKEHLHSLDQPELTPKSFCIITACSTKLLSFLCMRWANKWERTSGPL